MNIILVHAIIVAIAIVISAILIALKLGNGINKTIAQLVINRDEMTENEYYKIKQQKSLQEKNSPNS